ncbi:MAG: 2-succinyl-6-hydroxy-2,4-cyclohexadiene-1-carboxylate synthase [Anaerolineae bacterium]
MTGSIPEGPTRLAVHRLVRGAPGTASGRESSGRGQLGAVHAPLVLLHGFTGDATTWSGLVPHLGSAREVYAIDLVGHGDSPDPGEPGSYTIAATVQSVAAAWARTAAGAAHWLGYSMGGRVALNLAMARPDLVASLTLVGASPGIGDAVARRERVAADEELASFIETEGVPAFVDRWMAHPLFASQGKLGPGHLARAREQRLRNRGRAMSLTLRGMGTGAMEPVGERLPELELPVLLVTGADDAKFCRLAREMEERLPAAQRAVLPHAGHAVHVEAPDALAVVVNRFLQHVEAV